MTNEEKEVVKTAARIARGNPILWQKFVDSIHVLSSTQINHLVQSPAETLQLAQGRAQSSAHIFGLLAACVETADKIESKTK